VAKDNEIDKQLGLFFYKFVYVYAFMNLSNAKEAMNY